MELIIVNDAPDQHLAYDHKNVRIINKKERCESLGEKRNLANSCASHNIIVNVDDDDIFLPWFISEMYKGLGDNDFYRSSAYFFSEGESLDMKVRLCPGSPSGILMYTKEIFVSIGGYKNMNSGEDQDLLERLHGKTEHKTTTPGYMYRWHNGVNHISGADRQTGWEKAESVHRSNDKEPRGNIELWSGWRTNYLRLVTPLLYSPQRRNVPGQ